VTLTPTSERFILHWGEMGAAGGSTARWPDSALALSFSQTVECRGNRGHPLSRTIECQQQPQGIAGLGIVRIAHVMGDRRDHFESMKDVWEMFRTIMDERKKREKRPDAPDAPRIGREAKKEGADAYTRPKVSDMLEFFELMTAGTSRREKCRSAPS